VRRFRHVAGIVVRVGIVEAVGYTRRGDVLPIDKQLDGHGLGRDLPIAEVQELAKLQSEMLEHRYEVAPLPIEEVRELHESLKGEV